VRCARTALAAEGSDLSDGDAASSRRRSVGFWLGLKRRSPRITPPGYREKAAELPGGNMKTSSLGMVAVEADRRIIEEPDDFGRIWSTSELPGDTPELTQSELENAPVRVAGTDTGLQTVKGEEGRPPTSANLAAGGQRQSHALSFMEYQED